MDDSRILHSAYEDTAAERDRLREQRDALLEALQEIMDDTDLASTRREPSRDTALRHRGTARAAIAAARED